MIILSCILPFSLPTRIHNIRQSSGREDGDRRREDWGYYGWTVVGVAALWVVCQRVRQCFQCSGRSIGACFTTGRGGSQWPDDVNHPEPIHNDKPCPQADLHLLQLFSAVSHRLPPSLHTFCSAGPKSGQDRCTEMQNYCFYLSLNYASSLLLEHELVLR